MACTCDSTCILAYSPIGVFYYSLPVLHSYNHDVYKIFVSCYLNLVYHKILFCVNNRHVSDGCLLFGVASP